LKNKPNGLFVIGIIIGGMIMLLILGLKQIPNLSLSNQAIPLTSTLANLPRLIALEPTGIHQVAAQPDTPPTITPPASLVPAMIAVSSTPTPLILSNEQQPKVIGYSGEGRPLDVYTFGTGSQERMIVAGIHGGDEWNTITLANKLIKYLNQNPSVIPENVKLYILPNLNPDGEARAHNKYGRLNHNGVDLNRNFPVNWQKDWDRAGCWNSLPTSGGTGPGSETETQTLMKFIEDHHIEALISYHSAALGIFPGGLPPDQNSTRLAQSIAEVSSYPFPPIDIGCTYSGTLADYAVSKAIAAVDLELTNHFDTDFDQNLDILKALLNFELP
jgi:predicted deacylase